MRAKNYPLAAVLALLALAAPGKLRADSVYVITAGTPAAPTGSGNFGTVDLSTGAYTAISTGNIVGASGIDETPGGNLYEYNFENQLLSINPTTGATTLIGTGSIPTSPVGMFFTTAGLSTGAFYAINFNGDLYSINLTTGATTLVGNTGINLEGGGGVCEETGLAGSATNLFYATGLPATCGLSNQTLYSIDPTTAAATVIGSNFGGNNDPVVGAAYDNGALYGFTLNTNSPISSQVVQIDTTTGDATVLADTSQLVLGGVPAPVPEPSSLLLLGAGLIILGLLVRRIPVGVTGRPSL